MLAQGSWVRSAGGCEGVRDNKRVPGAVVRRSWCGPRTAGAATLEKMSRKEKRPWSEREI